MTDREAYIAFNMIPEIGHVRLQKMMDAAGAGPAAVYESLPDGKKVSFDGGKPDWRKEMELAAKGRITLVTQADPEYPERLYDLASPPLCLYVAGRVEALSSKGVAIVGTRRCTQYGRDAAERFAYALAAAGWTVFSGLAAGIDACAHRGALAANGSTVGVLGGAMDRFFPSENRLLAREMLAKGAVVTEYPFGRQPDTSTFPQRNRIVAALAKGVIAAECPEKSGTQITVSFAADLGRTVMAIPGGIYSPMSSGCLSMIRDGACLVRSPDDVFEELEGVGESAARRPPRASCASKPAAPASKPAAPAAERGPAPGNGRGKHAAPAFAPGAVSIEESLVMRALGDAPSSIDSVVRACGLSAARTNVLLVGLRMKRKVRFLPGNRVAACCGVREP